jgi:hypothetical protein
MLYKKKKEYYIVFMAKILDAASLNSGQKITTK